MGLIRKTLSISTLGLVGWKSKKERLADAEEELTRARVGLERTQAELHETAQRRERLEKDLRSTRSDLDATELSALRDTRSARRKGRWQGRWQGRLRGRRGVLSSAKERAAPLVASALDAGARVSGDVEPVVDDVRARSRRARKRAERRADELRYRTTGRSKRFGTRFRVFGRKAAKQARHRADDVREAASEARQAVADRTRH